MSYVPPIDREIKDFYKDHVDSLYRSCCFLTGGQGDGEAMVRTIFHRLLSKGLEFSSDRDARAWMILEACKLARKPDKLLPAIAEPEEAPAEEIVPVEQEETAEPEETAAAEEPVPQDTQELPQAAEEETASLEAREETEEKKEAPREAKKADGEPEPAPSEPEQSAPEEARNLDAFTEIRKLSYKNRLVALMYYCEGYRKSEIASYLGCPEFRIRSRLRKVAKLIQEDAGGEMEC